MRPAPTVDVGCRTVSSREELEEKRERVGESLERERGRDRYRVTGRERERKVDKGVREGGGI